ncbi:hypothetical protein VCHA53O466_50227 [Vibrio chagasii]|nr:hypothetical protein VCHA53O466_50227 [Vibrio chagasii]
MNAIADKEVVIKQVVDNSYSVDNLLERVGLKANSKLWSSIDGLIQVHGEVGKIREVGKVVYFNLSEGSHQIQCKCPKHSSPSKGELIVFSGQVSVTPSKFHEGLSVTINGRPSGIWAPYVTEAPHQTEIEKSSWLKMDRLIHSRNMDEVVIVGTETAMIDIQSQLDSSINPPEFCRVSMSDKTKILDAVTELSLKNDAILLARGGDDKTLDIWDDHKFINQLINLDARIYVALGHSHKSPLINQYADEAFPTPTAMGQSLNQIITNDLEAIALKEKVSSICKDVQTKKQSNDALQVNLAQVNAELVMAKSTNKRLKLILAITFVSVVVGIFIYFSNK